MHFGELKIRGCLLTLTLTLTLTLGFGFVTYKDPRDAEDAARDWNG